MCVTHIRNNCVQDIIQMDWTDFFNTTSWFVAAQESFLTFALLGPSVLSICSRPQCDQSTNLRCDLMIATLLTIVGLVLAAILASVLFGIVLERDPILAQQITGLFIRCELQTNNVFLNNFDSNKVTASDASPVRLATELFPAAMSSLTPMHISAFWSGIGCITCIALGLTQLYAMWLPIVQLCDGLYNAFELSCFSAAILAVPLATRYGRQLVVFFAVAVGQSWVPSCVCLAQVLALFVLLGRPYSADFVVRELRLGRWLATGLAIVWNIVCPLGLITLAILQCKLTGSREFYVRAPSGGEQHWPYWVRVLGACVQIGLVGMVPAVAVIQAYRYMTGGPADMFDVSVRVPTAYQHLQHCFILVCLQRIKLLVRPEEISPDAAENIEATITSAIVPEPVPETPPLYTPPPSYSTATGARLAKALRSSFRRSVRR